ncbi:MULTISPECIES: ABC transporter permease subunit [Paracoccus]|jgi:sulfonate transport system permease protein|uniref:Binding-protein-dependent transport systems inner membrane component n=1 Tax=Paracoccus denitrificans (strain Pd 1222) TaxID=318586 RepID=A1BC21_PARDP|nr:MULTISPECIES: ABC transporter permease subunit [Paracoccus]ABL73065.1 binding-protein-dependent transport systems inner membrane component [Paracoccus denitrificans PD1222]MBB4628440.1 sulfonate transport system permease protein [Paracoccus denitrificans]MCU7429651.1 ABC transporter permease subunit [Paracoccus denitrificans]MDK8873816.1 ABC transporter permease subunit [Paracoccus sp. SSJ]QAR29457.1 ABC transporter permease subunit [Paracoccus denitrificans]
MSITEIDRSYAALRKDRPAEPADALVRLTPATARGRQVPRWLRRGIGPVALVLVWHLASITGVLPAEVLAGPATVLSSAAKLIQTGELQEAVVVSMQRAMSGLLIGGTIGVALAILSGLTRLGEDLVDAPMQMLRTVPNVALIPLLIIWFGIGEAPKIALIALATAFPLYLNVYAGIRGVDQSLIEAGRTLGLGRAGLVRHVILPGALPNALVGLRYSLGIAWLALVFGEQINATAGVGYLMANAREFFQTDVIVVCLVVYALLGLAVDLVVRSLERIFLSWRPNFTGA